MPGSWIKKMYRSNHAHPARSIAIFSLSVFLAASCLSVDRTGMGGNYGALDVSGTSADQPGVLNKTSAPGGSDVPCIVVLGDPHLPYKRTEPAEVKMSETLVRAKQKVVDDINGWAGVTRVVAVGDIAGSWGTDGEYRFAAEFLSRLSAPFVPITGNHDYIYKDELDTARKLHRGDAACRAEKLRRFISYFHVTSLQREECIAGYELVYLSTDSTDARYQVGLSESSLRWLEETLRRTADKPTVVFYHAPLAGTLIRDGKPIQASSSYAAQPAAAIDAILKRNPQVFLWVSGHTHTVPGDPSFDSPQNLYDGRITDIHCSDMGHERISTNILWLYPDRVVVKTYDHDAGAYLQDKNRTIVLPVLSAKP